MTKKVKLTKRFILTKNTTDQFLQEVWSAAYQEVHINMQYGRISKFTFDDSEFVTKPAVGLKLSEYATNGAYHLLYGLRSIPGFAPSGKTLAPKHYVVEVLRYEVSGSDSFEVALLLTTEELILVESIGDKLILCAAGNVKEAGNLLSYLCPYQIELTSDTYISEFILESEK